MREQHERCHGPYRSGDQWRVICVGASRDRSSHQFASERAALDFIAAFRRNAETRTIAVAVEAYIASQRKRVTEGELRTATVAREDFHLRQMMKLDSDHEDPERRRMAGDNAALDLRRLTPKLARELYDERCGAVDTHRNGLSVCKAFGRWCAERGWLPADPFASVKGRGRRKKGKPQLRVEESRLVIDTCVALLDTDDGAVCTLAYLLLSTRNGEVVLAKVRDVDDSGQLFWVPDSKTEAGKRQIEVPAVLRPGLLRLAEGRAPDAPLFEHAAGLARAQDWARREVWRICKLAGVPKVGPHGLRGTHATIADTAGATSELVAATLGHASTGITTGGAYIDRAQAAAARRRRSWQVLDGGRNSKASKSSGGNSGS